MKKIVKKFSKKIIFTFLGLFCASSMILGICFFVNPYQLLKNDEFQQETEGATSNYSNTQIAYSQTFKTRAFLPEHYNSRGRVCGGSNVNVGGNWTGTTEGAIEAHYGDSVSGEVDRVWLFTADEGTPIGNVNCSYCQSNFQVYVIPYTLTNELVPVSNYGTYTLEVKEMDSGESRDIVTIDHYFEGSIKYDHSNADGGGSEIIHCSSETSLPSITVPKRTNYKFAGYWTSSRGGDSDI